MVAASSRTSSFFRAGSPGRLFYLPEVICSRGVFPFCFFKYVCESKLSDMNIEQIREYCLSLRNVTESFPFDDVSLVFKVEDKMFLLLPLDAEEASVSLKCNPEKAEMLRDRYRAVEPAFHFHKKYWNTIYLGRDMEDEEIKHWIRHSYAEVIAKLPKRLRDQYSRND